MSIDAEDFKRISGYLTFAAAVAILFSITASQWLLGFAIAALLASRTRLHLPPIWLPLAFFLAGTLLSMAFSPEPLHGLPQVKKMYVFFMLLVAFCTIREARVARWLFLSWAAVGGAVGAFGLGQYAVRLYQAHAQHQDLYMYYMLHRFTGFMSHVMTFSGEDMVVLLMLVAFLLFAPRISRPLFLAGFACLGLMGAILLAAGARTVWLGVAVGGFWLVWRWKPWLAVGAPLAILALLWAMPGPVHQRFVSIFEPKRDVDSNEFRLICFRTGARMIEAHPLLGIGLDETKYHFLEYIPPDTRYPRPPGFYQHLHNVYLQYAAERGIPTLLMMLWLLAMTLRDFSRALRKLPPGRSHERFLLSGGIATVIGIMMSGIFEVNLGDSEVLTVFLVVVACAYVAAQGALKNAPAAP